MNSDRKQVVIVGGGLIGLLAAWYLSRANRQVLVIDRRHTGLECSWAGAGILSPLYPDRYLTIRGLVASSQEEYPQLAHELTTITGIDPELQACNLLVFTDAGSQQHAGANTINRGTTKYASAHIRSPRLLQALRRALAAKGVAFLDNCEMRSLEVKDERLVGILTNRGLIQTRQCIVATGAWTGALLKVTGLSLPIIPIKGQIVVFRAVPGLFSDVIVRDYKYILSRKDGRILVGSTLENTAFDKNITRTAFDALCKVATEFFPAISDYPAEYHWAGLRPGSPDDCPFIADHPAVQGLVVCAGHYRNGFATGPASARLAVDLLLKRSPSLDPTPFRIDRPLPRWSDVLK